MFEFILGLIVLAIVFGVVGYYAGWFSPRVNANIAKDTGKIVIAATTAVSNTVSKL
jgi:hypothetical protein